MSEQLEPANMVKFLSKAVGGLVSLSVTSYALKLISISLKTFTVYKELEEIAGEDFARACLKDNDCFRIMEEIAEESLKAEAETPEEEKKKYREKILNELKEKLKDMGIELYCVEKDLGEFGYLYEDCFIKYKTFEFSITKDLKD